MWQHLRGKTGSSWLPARKLEAQSYNSKEWIWPKIWMPLEANSPLKSQERNSAMLSNWILFCDTVGRGLSRTMYPVSWPAYCAIINFKSNRNLTHMKKCFKCHKRQDAHCWFNSSKHLATLLPFICLYCVLLNHLKIS